MKVPSESTMSGIAFRAVGMIIAFVISLGAVASVVPYAKAEDVKRVESRQTKVEEKVEKQDEKIDDIKDDASETKETVAGVKATQKEHGKQLDRIEELLLESLKKKKKE